MTVQELVDELKSLPRKYKSKEIIFLDEYTVPHDIRGITDINCDNVVIGSIKVPK